MSDKLKISVLMAAYNEQETIAQAIESILVQSFKNWHLVVVDDCSIDNTNSILQRYAHKLPGKITICRNKNNLGLAESLIKGVSFCKADYIARMDADDICKSDRFLKQVEFLESHPEVALVSGAMEYIDEDGKVFGRTYPITSPAKIRAKMLSAGNVIVHPAVMMRRSVYMECGGYCAGLTGGQDGHLWMKFLRNGYSLAMLPTPLIAYRVRGKAISTQKTIEQSRLLKKMMAYDNPPQNMIAEYQKEIQKGNERPNSVTARKKLIENSMHCRIWRLGRKLKIPEKISEAVICGFQNTMFFKNGRK
jgi:glycosyltransferase involved in cell wall biosynthesis